MPFDTFVNVLMLLLAYIAFVRDSGPRTPTNSIVQNITVGNGSSTTYFCPSDFEH